MNISTVGVVHGNEWYLDINGDNLFDINDDVIITFSSPGGMPVTGDWNGDGVTEAGIKREPRDWYLDINGNRQYDDVYPEVYFHYGISGDIPVSGVWQ